METGFSGARTGWSNLRSRPLWHKRASLKLRLHGQTSISNRESSVVRSLFTFCLMVAFADMSGGTSAKDQADMVPLVLPLRMQQHKCISPLSHPHTSSSSIRMRSSCKHGATWLLSVLHVNSGMRRTLLRRLGRLCWLNADPG